MKFSSYVEDIPEDARQIDELLELQAKDESVKRQAAHQVAIDSVQAANRAAAMRQMTHQDLIASYRASAGERKAQMDRQLKKHSAGSL